MNIDDAFFEPGAGGTFVPSAHTEGPWDPRYQHGGPPAALLTRAVEGLVAGEGLTLARLSFDLLGPVPREPVRVAAWIERPGRRVQLMRATLSHGDHVLVTASAWAVRVAPDEVPHRIEATALVPPAQVIEWDPTGHPGWRCGFLAATEWRFVRGDYSVPGAAVVWLRPRVPLLVGEPMSAAQRVVLTADSANGVSATMDIDRWTFIPPELTVHLLRPSVGEWHCLDAESLVWPGCVGLATAAVHDEGGLVARTAQALLVSPRQAAGGPTDG
jgi:hypothetical protein